MDYKTLAGGFLAGSIATAVCLQVFKKLQSANNAPT